MDGGHGFYTVLQSVVVSNLVLFGGSAGVITGLQTAYLADGGHGIY